MTVDPHYPEDHRTRVLMVGPLPPPNGGVANFTRNVRDIFSTDGRYTIKVHQTGPGVPRPPPAVQLVQELGRLLRFFSELKRYDPSIVHVHTSIYYSIWRNLPYLLWARHASDAHVVVHMHSGQFKEYYRSANALDRSVVMRIMREADAIIVTSPSWTEVVREVVGPGKEVSSLPNGFDPAVFRPMDRGEARRELGIPVQGRVLLAVGYLETVKGHRHLIDAMQEVSGRNGDVCLYIIGNGSLREPLEAQVRELGLDGRVHFVHEALPSSRVALWMGASDMVVLSSLNEGNPTVMFESLGCGRPFVGSRVGGIPDVITSQDLGMLCPPGDPHALATTIMDALERDWDCRKIADHAQRYSWASIASRLCAIYDGMEWQ